ncbi:MAG: DUF484 family protein [Gammaproteobacteria bacterium]|nr:DUF484 family protein [Gammaproteobacteria bacterium]
MQPEKQDTLETMDEQSVLRFLTGNPDFFNQHPDVLNTLRIPHHTGSAVSLIEKQVSVLRKKCTSLEGKLTELIGVARENEQLHQRLHLLIQEIITAHTLDDIVCLTRESLMDNFRADDVRILLIDDKKSVHHEAEPDRFLAHDDPGLKLFEKYFAGRETVCGVPPKEILDCLFGAESDSVGSVAIIPLYHKKELGLAVLSSSDEHRFGSGIGVMFLNQLGEVLSRRISGLF